MAGVEKTAKGAPDPLETALDWMGKGYDVALATVLGTWGSAPRPAGSLLVVRDDGAFEGSVSGGCVEGDVIVEAEEVIKSGSPRELTFGVSDEDALGAGLACGGRIRIYLESLTTSAGRDENLKRLEDLLAARRSRQALLHVIDLDSGGQVLADPVRIDDAVPYRGAAFVEAVAEAQRLDRPVLLETDGKRLFLNVHNPPLRLVLIGAVHIAQALAPMAQALGYDVTVIDPRGAFATTARFSGVRLVEDWPDTVLVAERPDPRTAVVTLTHDPKLDDAALIEALGSSAFYIGSLGSRKTHNARLDRLLALGIQKDALSRICAPVGLAIGARSPAEIAIAIMAEITQSLRQGGAIRSS